jgi:hypothetical protein
MGVGEAEPPLPFVGEYVIATGGQAPWGPNRRQLPLCCSEAHGNEAYTQGSLPWVGSHPSPTPPATPLPFGYMDRYMFLLYDLEHQPPFDAPVRTLRALHSAIAAVAHNHLNCERCAWGWEGLRRIHALTHLREPPPPHTHTSTLALHRIPFVAECGVESQHEERPPATPKLRGSLRPFFFLHISPNPCAQLPRLGRRTSALLPLVAAAGRHVKENAGLLPAVEPALVAIRRWVVSCTPPSRHPGALHALTPHLSSLVMVQYPGALGRDREQVPCTG